MSLSEYRRIDDAVPRGKGGSDSKFRISSETIGLLCGALDAVAIIASIVTATALYEGTNAFVGSDVVLSIDRGALTALLFVVIFGLRNGYGSSAILRPANRSLELSRAWALTFFLLAVIGFLFKATAVFSRGSVITGFVAGPVSLILCRAATAKWLRRRFDARTLSVARVFLVLNGDAARADVLIRTLREAGNEIAGVSVVAPRHRRGVEFSLACVTASQQLKQVMSRSAVDAVYLFASWRHIRSIEELRAVLSPVPIPIYLFPDDEIAQLLQGARLDLADLAAFEIERAPLSRWERAAKRATDIMIVSVALPILSPIFLFAAIGVALESGRPILFRQQRRGYGGRPFDILKFRSMNAQENGPVVRQAKKNDRRVTWFGALLRRTSIDELPQLVNVLRGEMSIVGPRPHAIAHDEHYARIIARYALRHRVKPGMTGWAQVNGLRGETEDVRMMEARISRDLWYINNWSYALDLRIVVLTAFQLLRRADAH